MKTLMPWVRATIFLILVMALALATQGCEPRVSNGEELRQMIRDCEQYTERPCGLIAMPYGAESQIDLVYRAHKAKP